MGTVISTDPDNSHFVVESRSTDRFEVYISQTTSFDTFRYLGSFGRDRVQPQIAANATLNQRLATLVAAYVKMGATIAVEGTYIEQDGKSPRFDARVVYTMSSKAEPGQFEFETTHWWLNQIERLADEWLDDIFGDKRTYVFDDFAALYRTNLNILGLPTDNNIQEMATLSRLIYGLSSAYLLTGNIRYFLAAKAGVEYQRSTFRCLTHDGRCCFWFHGRLRGKYGTEMIFGSLNDDDKDTVPLYEQIYALAGLTQFYRITNDPDVLVDIQRTVEAFLRFFRDDELNKKKDIEQGCNGFKGLGGFFSHIDIVSLRPDSAVLDQRDNRSKKNWNSVGDHIPAYLINLILALDPLPKGLESEYGKLLEVCRDILDETSKLIVEHFPDPEKDQNKRSPFVRERFLEDWTYDKTYRWQQDRAIVGHNLKIAWNLTRVAKYYRCLAAEVRTNLSLMDDERIRMAKDREAFADKLVAVASRLADDMAVHGVDQIRGGIFDAVERQPMNGMNIDFAWRNTKDFWQQEQGILAYQILYGEMGDKKSNYLALARETAAFWNLFFLDHDNRGIFFRVSDIGVPIIRGSFANKGGHAISGYHAFELNFLSHIYLRTYFLTGATGDAMFSIHLKPSPTLRQRSINVLPDFMNPGDVAIKEVLVNGIPRGVADKTNFQLPLQDEDLDASITVVFESNVGHYPSEDAKERSKSARIIQGFDMVR